MQSVASQLAEYDVTPIVTASSAYTSGNQVGGVQTLDHPCFAQGRFTLLTGLSIIDIDNQKAPLTILLFNQVPTIASSDKSAFSITTANLTAACIAQITIASTDYQTVSSQAVGTKTFTNLFLNSIDNGGKIYAACVTTGTPTYTTTTSLLFRWTFAKNF